MEQKEISEIVKASIETKIIEAFKETPEMIDELVRACLSQEVNEHGGKPDYGYGRNDKMPYLTYLARKVVQQVAERAVRLHIESMEERIGDLVRASLTSEAVVDAFTKQMIAQTNNGWNIKISFVPDAE